jgi:uncharacterized membrane protein HdeD (DUF308 family)
MVYYIIDVLSIYRIIFMIVLVICFTGVIIAYVTYELREYGKKLFILIAILTTLVTLIPNRQTLCRMFDISTEECNDTKTNK